MDSPWICWVYQYSVGGMLFAGSLALALRSGALSLKHAPDRRLLAALLAGLLGFAAVHAAWISAVWP